VMNSRFLVTVLAVTLVACATPDAPEKAARDFLDTHYVHMDLQKSHSLAVGVAVDKIQKEIDLLDQVSPDSVSERPSIRYALKGRTNSDGAEVFEYELQIHAGSGSFTKLVLLTVRPSANGWHVSNFSSTDGAP